MVHVLLRSKLLWSIMHFVMVMLFPMLTVLYIYISISRSTCSLWYGSYLYLVFIVLSWYGAKVLCYPCTVLRYCAILVRCYDIVLSWYGAKVLCYPGTVLRYCAILVRCYVIVLSWYGAKVLSELYWDASSCPYYYRRHFGFSLHMFCIYIDIYLRIYENIFTYIWESS
jgi:hypothetical protein